MHWKGSQLNRGIKNKQRKEKAKEKEVNKQTLERTTEMINSRSINRTIKKCKVLSITRKRHLLLTDYSLDSQVLDHVPSEKDVCDCLQRL